MEDLRYAWDIIKGESMKQQIEQLKAVIEAMETLSLSGSKNCGTYYNCMQMLAKTINELQAIDKDTENDCIVEVVENDPE